MYDNLLSGSGGSTKAIQLAVAFKAVKLYGFKPDLIAGTSASSFLALPFELGLIDKAISEALDVTRDEFFIVNPFNKKGSISGWAYLRIAQGFLGRKEHYSLGIQDTRHFLKKYITEEMFLSYKENPDTADIAVMTVDLYEGKPCVYYAKQCTWNEYIEAVEKSAHIPVTTQAIDDEIDGGLFAHNPEWYLFHQEGIKPKSVISIYSREKQFKVARSDKYDKHLFNYIHRTLELFNVALSTAGEGYAEYFCKANGIDRKVLYCKQILDEMYDFDKHQLIEAAIATEIDIAEQIAAWSL